MTVQVRSMKMTRSLFNQLLQPNPTTVNADDLVALGWVFIREKYIIVNDHNNGVLYKVRPVLFTGTSICGTQINFKAGQNVLTYQFQSSTIAERWVNLMKRLMAEALEQGQIFL